MLTIWKLCTKHDVKFVQHFTDHIVYIGYGKSATQKEGRQAKMTGDRNNRQRAEEIRRYILDRGTQFSALYLTKNSIGRIVIKDGVGYWNGHKSRFSEVSALACVASLDSDQVDFKVTENDCTYYATYDIDTGKLIKWQ